MKRNGWWLAWAAGWMFLAAGCGDDDSTGDADVTPDMTDEDGGDGQDVPDVVEAADEAQVEVEADVVEETDVEEVADEAGPEVGFCEANPDGTACDDGDLCTTDDACSGGACVGDPVVCDDGNQCTDDSCDAGTGGCVHPAHVGDCEDGDPCTVGDACVDVLCTAGAAKDCSAVADDCNDAACNGSTGDCYAVPHGDGTACEDGDLCTLDDACTGGVCLAGLPPDCSHLTDGCNTGVCEAATGDCIADPASDGTVCVDPYLCTTGDRCLAGVCSGDRPDVDGDSFYAAGCADGDDCDDARYDVNPGRTEGPTGRDTCFDRLDNDCDGTSDLSDPLCDAGLDWGNLDTPTTVTVNVGAATPFIRGRAFELGQTEAAGPWAALSAEIGWGPTLTDPTGSTAWTWTAAEYFGQGGPGNAHDVFAGSFTAPPAGTYAYTYRYSIDGGATWLYVDTDGNGSELPSNGFTVDRVGTLNVIVNDHVVISEIVLLPTSSEYVEIYNPTATTIDLANYYLTDTGDTSRTWRYWDVVQGSGLGLVADWDFLVRFPAGATLAPGARAVVSLRSAQTFNSSFARLPTYEACPGTPDEGTVPNMRSVWANSQSCYSSGVLQNSDETLVLFRWDGAADLVTDVDYVNWGATIEAMSKTGISRDGPDAGTTATAYRADTAVVSQSFTGAHAVGAAAHGSGGSLERVEFGEPGETRTGGNGITNNDETSEPLSSTWRVSTAATPGS